MSELRPHSMGAPIASRHDFDDAMGEIAVAPPVQSRAELYAVDLEKQVLGSALLDNRACASALLHLEPEYFEGRGHRPVFETMLELHSRGDAVNLVTVADAGSLDTSLLVALTDVVASTANVEYQARILREKYMARRAYTLMRSAQAEIARADIIALLGRLTGDLSALTVGGQTDTHIRHAVAEALALTAEWEEHGEDSSDMMPTGFYGLDKAVGGFPVGEVTTFAAMTGAGKTSWLVQAVLGYARRTIKQGRSSAALIVSAEMSRRQIALRAASNWARVNLRRLRSGEPLEEERQRLERALGAISSLPIHVDDEPRPTLQHIAARAQHIASTGSLGLIAIDYDEKIGSEGQSEELRVSAIAQGLKELAKRFEVPVVALSQYSRKASPAEWPDDAWLRYSGMKVHESALILHWHWPRYWEKKGVNPDAIKGWRPDRPDLGQLICTKNRFGPTRNAEFVFDETTTYFEDLAETVMTRHHYDAPF